jgi:5-methylthioadenosine/S-adenosylhomocysteine deaminase
MQTIDTLIRARWIVPVEPDARVLEGHALAVHNGRVVALEPTDELLRRFMPTALVDRPDHVLLPGFVDARAQPAAAPWRPRSMLAEPAQVRDATELGISNLLRSGTTCYADDATWPDVAARCASERRVRACVGLPVAMDASGWAQGPDEYIERGMRLRDEYRGDPLVSTRFAAPALDELDEPVWQRLRRLADELEIAVAMPVHRSVREIERSVAAHGARPLARLDRLGLVSPQLTALHLTHCGDPDLDLLAAAGASVVHCPSADLFAGHGVCALPRLLGRGVRTALGTDVGANADLDLLREAGLALLLAAGVTGTPSNVIAADLLRIATLEGARTLGLGEQIGSLVPGKWADVCCMRLQHSGSCEPGELATVLVSGARARTISDVWVAGRALVADGQLLGVDEAEIEARNAAWRRRARELAAGPES